jgi:hypothetical protein
MLPLNFKLYTAIMHEHPTLHAYVSDGVVCDQECGTACIFGMLSLIGNVQCCANSLDAARAEWWYVPPSVP